MQRLQNLANKYQKRLIRPLYAQTQAYPYAATLDDTFRNSDGTLHKPLSGDTTPLNTRTADAFTHKSSLVPGLVMVRTSASKVGVASGVTNAKEQALGLLANWIGGELDEGFSGDSLQNEVGVWRGPDGVFEILAPGFDDTGLAAATEVKGDPILLVAGADGRLVYADTPTSTQVVVAHLIERVSAKRIVVDLKV